MADDTPDSGPDARPIPCRSAPDVSIATGPDGGATTFYLKNASGQVFSFGAQEYFLWQSLDGRTAFSDIAQRFTLQFGMTLTRPDLATFIAQGVRGGLLEWYGDPSHDLGPELAAASARGRRLPADGPTAPPHGREPFTVIIGDPTRLFTVLAIVCGPLCYVKWLWFPGAFLGLMIMVKHWPQYQADWQALEGSIPFWPCMYGFEHALAFLSRIVEGTIILAYGGSVRYLGLRFFMGILIRGFIDESTVRQMPRRVRIWSKAGPLLFRLAVFDISTLVWIECRGLHPLTSKTALFCTVLAVFTLCLNACPLVAAEGYELLATYLNQPELQSRAFRYLGLRLGGRAPPTAMTTAERVGLAFFAVGTVLVTGFIILHILLEIDSAAIGAVQGLGFFFVVVVFVVSGLYFYLLIKFGQKTGAMQKAAFAANQQQGLRQPDF